MNTVKWLVIAVLFAATTSLKVFAAADRINPARLEVNLSLIQALASLATGSSLSGDHKKPL